MTAVEERLARIEEKLDRLVEEVAHECALHTACRAVQAEHHKTLYGNGTDGLKLDVADLKHSRQVFRWGFRLVWTALMALSGALLGGAAQAWFRGP